ncbi:hypothetical protein MGYG_08526 [Nannizzia gypsea CBS 118893]|uniref:tRNA (guanine(26)-N(2))-dimethyltransferase n=1 Tax=Arthroderma gypseum (strain ATCC MYA-4604 / CBS 118893) TaxID=535722 RepID=E4V5Y6_ARTGP|nr:hypothetical protein MGYG_08526 [Nannizzia gypsea CBS 118893]EFR05511.1 hypothetical protein MGYG_08526 [Nannizzia gypsea CBS 118893]
MSSVKEQELYLQEIDPSPLDEIDNDLDLEAADGSSIAAGRLPGGHGMPSRPKLGLSGHSWDYWLSAVQKYSTYPPTIFLGLHFTNTALIPLATRSVADSETFLLLTRPIYQAPGLEPLIVYLPILAHVTSGVILRYLRQSRRAQQFGAETREQRRAIKSAGRPASVQAMLGYAMIPLLGSHILVNRLVPLYIDGGSSGVGLGYVAHGIARSPWFMGACYAALTGIGVWHVVGGWAWWFGWREVLVTRRAAPGGSSSSLGANGGYLGSRKGTELYQRKQRRRWIVNGLSLVGTALWFAGGLGVIGAGGLAVGWEAKAWDALYSQVPLVGALLVPAPLKIAVLKHTKDEEGGKEKRFFAGIKNTMVVGRLATRLGLGLRCIATKPQLLLSTANTPRAAYQLPHRMASTEEMPKIGTISSPPKQGQFIKHGSTLYKTIQEGLAYILVDQKDAEPAKPPPSTQNQKTTEGDRPSVFYNPIQQFNRDLSVLAIRAYGEHATAMKQKKRKLKLKGKKATAKKAKADETADIKKPIQAGTSSIGDRGEVKDCETAVNKRRRDEDETTAEDIPMKKLCTEASSNGEGIAITAAEELTLLAEDGAAKESAEKPAESTVPKPWTPSFTILDALSASGLRALRYAKEIPFATRVVGNDLSAAAIESMKLNVQHNDLDDIVHPNKGDACAYMYTVGRTQWSSSEPGGIPKFDVVDLDPYGTAAPFLDAAVQSVADGGLLCVTCTDAGVFAGAGYPEKTFALYGGIPIRGPHSHEGGLRLILHAIGTTAAKYGLAIEPMLSLSIDFYARVFVRIHKSPMEVKFAASKTMVSFNCDHGCGSWKTQRLAERKPQTGKDGKPFYSYRLAQGPTTTPNCEHCGFKTHLAGPMWAGPLHNPVFIQRILDLTAGADRDTYQTCPRIEGMLTTALEEDLDLDGSAKEPTPEIEPAQPVNHNQEVSLLIPRVDPALIEPYPFFFIVSNLSRVLRTSTMPENQFHGALRNLGYRSTRSHAKPNSIRTDAPWEVIWEIMREWIRLKSPIKPGALSDSTAGAGILRRKRHTLNPVPGEAPGLKALKRDLLIAVDSGKSIADVTMMVESALYRSGVHQSIETTERHTLDEEEKKERNNDKKEDNGNAKTTRSPSPRPDSSTLNVVFDEELGRKALDSHRRKRLKRYQANPRPNWGPIARAHVTNTNKGTS